MKSKVKPVKPKTFKVTLNERDSALLRLYAKDFNITRPQAIKRLVRESLKGYKSRKGPVQPDNQLDLFDAIQMDIFDN